MNLAEAKQLLPGNRVRAGSKAGVIHSVGYGIDDSDHFVRVVVDLDGGGGTLTLTGNMTRELEREVTRDVMGTGARPAVFDGKMLVRESTCPWHPKYQAKRAPRQTVTGACVRCVAIWLYVKSLERDEPVAL